LLHDSGPIDMFIHDSDHTRSHRAFEYRTAVTNLMRPGFILTDDDEDPDLLDDLANECSGHHHRVRSSLVDARAYIGGVRCP
jgi:hypothetical protein